MTLTAIPTLDDFYARYPRTLFAGTTVDDSVVTAALLEATSIGYSYMRGRYNLPILGSVSGGTGVYDPSIVVRMVHIAAYNLMTGRGFNPAPGGDETIRSAYYEAVGNGRDIVGWFPMVQRQSIHPDVIESSPNAPAHPFPSFTSNPPRGWGNC
jgi:phage gp36-like protein